MSLDSDTLLAVLAVCLKKKESERKKRKKRLWMKNSGHKKRSEFTYQDLLEELKMAPDNDFRHFLVNDASIYEEILQMIGPLIKKKDTLMREAIPVGLRLSTTLRFLATGEHFEYLKSSSLMSPLTISKIVLETCEAIISRLKDLVKLPDTPYAWKAVASHFYRKWKFPSCLGVVSGKHIAIVKPTGTESMYYNYKKFFSVVLMAVVNANYEFLAADVDISGNVSGHENFFQTSLGTTVNEHLHDLPNTNYSGSKRNLPYVFVGDEFDLNERFMKSFPQSDLTEEKQMFNYRLSQMHQIAENTFGALSSQFGVLQKTFYLAPEKVKIIVLACCYLYNFLRRKTENQQWDDIFDKDSLEDGIIELGSWREVSELTSLQIPITNLEPKNAKKVREQFMDYFNSKAKFI